MPEAQLATIDHIVVLMLENRSFDHMLGFLYADSNNTSPAPGPFRRGPPPAEIMGIFTPEMLPVMSGLARGFAVCDHWFGSVPTETIPNRAFVAAATSQGHMNDSTKSFTVPTIFGLLTKASVAWKIYGYDNVPLACRDVEVAGAVAEHVATHERFSFDRGAPPRAAEAARASGAHRARRLRRRNRSGHRLGGRVGVEAQAHALGRIPPVALLNRCSDRAVGDRRGLPARSGGPATGRGLLGRCAPPCRGERHRRGDSPRRLRRVRVALLAPRLSVPGPSLQGLGAQPDRLVRCGCR